MEFKCCPECGSLLSHRDLGDDQDVPWCDRCSKPWFPVFPVATISLVYDDCGNVLLLRQNYISNKFCNLVSGYIHPGETAEQCAVREIHEEVGLEVDKLTPVATNWFDKKQMLMVGFFAHVAHDEPRISTEVDDAFWCPAADMVSRLSDNPTSASRCLALEFLKSAARL